MLNVNSRQREVVRLCEKYGEITIKALSDMLNVSEMTIHRDLEYLQREKYLFKKRGAAVFSGDKKSDSVDFFIEEKRSIGKKAASMLLSGQTVILDNSTTAIECARFIDDSLKLTCYTTNIEIMNILAKSKSHIVYCSGGYYFRETGGFIGQHAESFVENIKADVAIIGASGISLEHGVTNPYPMHSSLQRKIIGAAKKCILLADRSKFDRVAMEKDSDISNIDTIVTDVGISEEVYNRYKEYVEIVIA